MSITLLIVIATSLISFRAFSDSNLKNALIFRPTLINDRKEYYRFLSSGLVHGDMMHLLINMYVLYQFGTQIESVFTTEGILGPAVGRVVYLIFYVSAIVFSSFPTYNRHKDNYAYSALGASGATSALVFAYILFAPWQWFVFPPLPGILLAFAFLAYSAYMDKRGTDNIGHNQHYWGAIYGVVFMVLTLYLTRPDILDRLFDNLLHPQASIF